MNIGFYHIEQPTQASEDGYLWASGLVRSARKVMPNARLVHFTDDKSRGVKGVDEVRRKPSEPMALLRMRHHAGVEGNWLFVDTDVYFERSVERVFRKDETNFEIGIANRNWGHLKPAMGFTDRMPFNSGVMFSRCPRFFGEVYTRLRQLPDEAQHWMGDQEVICELLLEDRPRYRIAFLSGNKFNYPPLVPDPDAESKRVTLEADVYITHYKGRKRKYLLKRRLFNLTRGRRQCA